MTLKKCMKKHTERQMLLWNMYFDRDRRPGKLEQYLMQVACEIRRVAPSMFGGKPAEILPEHFQMAYKEPPELVEGYEGNVGVAIKSIFVAAVGDGIRHERISRAEAIKRGMIDG